MIAIPICGPAYKSDSIPLNSQTCINMFPEINESDSKNVVALKPTPGLTLFSTLTGYGTIRGIYTTSNNRLFAICGDTLSEINSVGVATVMGTIGTNTGRVYMTDNGLELIIADGSAGYLFTLSTNTLSTIASGYPNGSHVVFLNQRFINNKPNTQQFYWSNLADGSTWDASNVASAEGTPDNINALVTLGGELWVFGPQSYEVFYDTGSTFARIQGSHSDVGCAAKYSPAITDANIFWLGGDDSGQGKVYTNQGYRPLRISNHAIEAEMQSYAEVSDAWGYTYQQDGHEFYVLSFPTANKTWVFDMVTGMWHERNYTDSSNKVFYHKGIVHDFYNEKNLVGDWSSKNIYILDTDKYTDDGDEITRERTTPHIWNNLERSFYSSFQLDMEVGVGLTSGQGSNPQVMLQISNDGGRTWGSEKWKSAGRIGEYKTRVKWNRLGTSRDRVFRIRMSDPVKWVILGGYLEVE